MIPPYPERLIPKQGYRRISGGIGAFFLQRSTPSKANTDASGRPLAAQLATPTIRFQHYSLNLIGVFQPQDHYWRVKADGYHDFWDFETPCQLPPIQDCEYNPQKGAFYFLVSDIDNKQIPYNRDVGEFYARCHTHHTPTQCNFWHFQLDWLDETGQAIVLNRNKGWRKRLLSMIRDLLSRYARTQQPPTQPLPAHLYKA